MQPDLPALLGGTPIRPDGPPGWPLLDSDVQAAVAGAMSAGAWGQYHGEHICALEAELAAFHDVPHALTCASGTLAVEAALRALRVGPGDEVVMAAYEYESNFLTVHALGAKPVLVDVHPHNWQLDETKLDAAFTPQTKAILCSHLHGGLVAMPAVMGIARTRGIGVVEDAAQALGAVVAGKPVGTWGDVGTLSFGGSKLLTAGRGGALLFNDAQLYQRTKTWLHRGLQQWAPLSELQATVLRPQLRKLRALTVQRAERVRELVGELTPPEGKGEERQPNPLTPFPKKEGGTEPTAVLSPSPFRGGVGEGLQPQPNPLTPFPKKEGGTEPETEEVKLFVALSSAPLRLGEGLGRGSSIRPFINLIPDSIAAFYKVGFQYAPGAFGLSREVFVKALRAEGIAFDPGFKALHIGRSPSRFRAAAELTHAADAHERCVMLHHPVLSGATADVQQVADAVAKVYRYRDRF